MSFSGKRKAAMLLMALGPNTAAELLKDASSDTIAELAAEMAYLDASGIAKKAMPIEFINEFSLLLRKGRAMQQGSFVKQLLDNTIGPEQSEKMLVKVQDKAYAKDPFLKVRKADVKDLARALEGESAQVASIVLAEMSPARSAELLSLLADEVRPEVIRNMTSGEDVSRQAKLRVASVMLSRLEAFEKARRGDETASAGSGGPAAEDHKQQRLRKVAVLLRSLDKQSRDGLVAKLSESDEEASKAVQQAMVLWEDIPVIEDRPLQEVLRHVDTKQLALAMVNADQRILSKVRENISERAGAMLDEETSLLSSPKEEEIEKARDGILALLRKANASGELSFKEEE